MNKLTRDVIAAAAVVGSRLREAGVAYLPVAAAQTPGRDHLGLLVAENDVARGKAATNGIAGVSVQFFSLAGAKSGGFRLDNPRYSSITLAIFPLETAEHLLSCAASEAGLGRLDEFHIAAYVQTYFRGSARLLALPDSASELGNLPALARAAGIDPAICNDRASLDVYLASAGWRPPVDMLERLGLADDWIQGHLLPQLVDALEVPAGLTVFFCRERAEELGFLDTMQMAIEEAGFEILEDLPLRGDLAALVRRSVRGGNWGAGPSPVNGGPPVHLFFAVDVFPVTPDETDSVHHPFLDNGRILTAKIAARDTVLTGISPGERFNAIHSADNSAETMRFAETVLPEARLAALQSTFLNRRAEVDELTRNTAPLEGRNTVALNVWHGGGNETIIRKIYRRQKLKSLQYDAEILEALSPEWPEFSGVRKRGETYLEIGEVGSDFVSLASLRTLAPISTVLRLRKILRAVNAFGYDPIAWDPGQDILVSPKTGALKILGFDHLQKRPRTTALGDSMCLTGQSRGKSNGYSELWYPVLGIPRLVFLNSRPLTMRLYRGFIYPLRKFIGYGGAGFDALKARLRHPVRSIRRIFQ